MKINMNKYYVIKKEELNSFLNYISSKYPDYKFFNNIDSLIKTINEDKKYLEYIFEFTTDKIINAYYKNLMDTKHIKLICFASILRKEKIKNILISL